jgi:hypothetical protein
MIEAPELLVGDRTNIANDNSNHMFPNLQLLMNNWVDTQVNGLAPVELSHGILATLNLQDRKFGAPRRALSVHEFGFTKITASLHGDPDQTLDHWVELWHLLGYELSAKLGQHLEQQWKLANRICCGTRNRS